MTIYRHPDDLRKRKYVIVPKEIFECKDISLNCRFLIFYIMKIEGYPFHMCEFVDFMKKNIDKSFNFPVNDLIIEASNANYITLDDKKTEINYYNFN